MKFRCFAGWHDFRAFEMDGFTYAQKCADCGQKRCLSNGQWFLIFPRNYGDNAK